jgi:Starch synthase catalytic domain
LARVPRAQRCHPCRLGRASTRDGLPVYVLLCPQLYDRPGNPYGDESGRDWPDNDIRFGRLASAAAELAAGILDKNWAADLVHANGWQAALVPAYLAWSGSKIPSILTIHNLAYQGLFPRESLRRIGAPDSSFHIDGVEFYNKLSFLKGGLIYATHLTTVSATCAREITTNDFGCGLQGLLRRRSEASQLTGILNGIDESWDPRFCAQLAQPLVRATGTASAPTPTIFARSSDLRSPAARCSHWSRASCIRRASTSCCPSPTRSLIAAGKSSLPALASTSSSRHWSTRIAGGPIRSGSRSASMTARRAGFSPAATSR